MIAATTSITGSQSGAVMRIKVMSKARFQSGTSEGTLFCSDPDLMFPDIFIGSSVKPAFRKDSCAAAFALEYQYPLEI